MACVRRTLIGVPAGTVTAFGAGAGAARRPVRRRLRGGWWSGAGLRAENSTATASASGISDTCAVVEQHADALAVARR